MKLRVCDLFHVILRRLPRFTFLGLTQTLHCDHHWGAFQKMLYPPTSISDWLHLQEKSLSYFPSKFFLSHSIQCDSDYTYNPNAATGLALHFEEKPDYLWALQNLTMIWWPTLLLPCPSHSCLLVSWLFIEFLRCMEGLCPISLSVACPKMATYMLTSQWGYSQQLSQNFYLLGIPPPPFNYDATIYYLQDLQEPILNLSKPQFSHLWNDVKIVSSPWGLGRIWWNANHDKARSDFLTHCTQ